MFGSKKLILKNGYALGESYKDTERPSFPAFPRDICEPERKLREAVDRITQNDASLTELFIRNDDTRTKDSLTLSWQCLGNSDHHGYSAENYANNVANFISYLCEILKANHTINKITFYRCHFNAACYIDLFKLLQANNYITHFTIQHSNYVRSHRAYQIQGSGLSVAISELSKALATNKTLKHLDLSNNYIDDFDVRELCKGLKQNNTLRVLDLSNQVSVDTPAPNIINAMAINQLHRALKDNTSLISLNLFSYQRFFSKTNPDYSNPYYHYDHIKYENLDILFKENKSLRSLQASFLNAINDITKFIEMKSSQLVELRMPVGKLDNTLVELKQLSHALKNTKSLCILEMPHPLLRLRYDWLPLPDDYSHINWIYNFWSAITKIKTLTTLYVGDENGWYLEYLDNYLKNNYSIVSIQGKYIRENTDKIVRRNQKIFIKTVKAVREGNLKLTKEGIQKGVSILAIVGNYGPKQSTDYSVCSDDTYQEQIATANTLLHWAVINGHEAIAKFIMTTMRTQGVPLDIPNKAGLTASQCAKGTKLECLFETKASEVVQIPEVLKVEVPRVENSQSPKLEKEFTSANVEIPDGKQEQDCETNANALNIIETSKLKCFAATKNNSQVIHTNELDNYVIIDANALKYGDQIAVGGQGAVHKGTWGNKTVAIKKMLAQNLDDEQKKQLIKEIRLMNSVQCNYVVKLKALCLDYNEIALVMDFFENGSLKSYLFKHANITWELKAKFVNQILCALVHLHQLNIIHRDLKSDNVLVSASLEVKVTDLGSAVLKPNSEKSYVTYFPEGTRFWSAPEIHFKKFEDPKHYSEKSDMYSFGVLVWQICTEKELFGDDYHKSMELYKKNRKGEREKISPATPKIYRTIIDLCWQKEPKKRPNGLQVREMLDQDMRNKLK